ncbi:MAG TPA: DUF4388 domain-containing protein [Dongiaceae bacterium]|nr:DUF4388 domain-containing protein [Dongiaceae bacterium]
MQPLPDSQPIAGLFVPRLVARLHREGFDGSLRLHAGGATRVIYFRRGDIASAASNAEEDRLPSLLIREGRLTGPQVEMAKQKQRPGVSLGKTLIELGFLTPSELLAGARRQVRQILSACFALADGTWQTIPGPLGPEVTNLGLPTRRLIFDALMETGDRSAIVREMGSMESVYRPSEGLAAALPTLRLDSSMEEVARMTDGDATLREVSGRTRLDDFTVSRIVLGLEILGLVELASRPEPVAAPRPASRLIPVEAPPEEPAMAPMPDPARAEEVRDAEPRHEDARAPERVASRPEPVIAAAPTAAAFTIEDDEDDRTEEPPAPAAPPQAAPEASPFGGPSFGAPAEPTAHFGGPTFAAPSDTDAEPPPFPSDELPAFATNGAPSPSGWSEDPQTGERVHAGPIELTFDGPVGPGGAPATTARRVAIAAVVAVVVLGGAAAFFLRPGGSAAESAPPPGAPQATAPRETVPQASAPANTVAEASAPAPPPAAAAGEHDGSVATTEPAAADREKTGEESPTMAGGSPAAEPPAAQPPAATRPPAPPPAGTAPPPATTPVVARTEPAHSPPAHLEHPAGAVDLSAGQALLDAGDLGGAEAAFEAAIRNAPAGGATLQILIACDPVNIGKARAATAPGGDLFALPVAVKDRACHRLLWGMYADAGSARADIARLPVYFKTAGVNPVPVALEKLRRPR